MSDETGERDDDVTVDEQGAVVNRIGDVVQDATAAQIARERARHKAWMKEIGMEQ
jgi:hypothetical protein